MVYFGICLLSFALALFGCSGCWASEGCVWLWFLGHDSVRSFAGVMVALLECLYACAFRVLVVLGLMFSYCV